MAERLLQREISRYFGEIFRAHYAARLTSARISGKSPAPARAAVGVSICPQLELEHNHTVCHVVIRQYIHSFIKMTS